ncbi:MAG: ribose-phosphate pyrophosphokinase [Oscillospiraceae bacterium]|nr:ribose-phosphate pyrophosphokinase [Oscillospiraceae bacterium]MDD6145990.1 ribose-phosphate pyrophosphokinase [Oscillospiraceae bacterium]
MSTFSEYLDTIPQGRLGIIAMRGCEEFAKKISDQIVECRAKYVDELESSLHLKGYHRDSYLLDANFPRFATGEGKGVINESIRGYDLFIISDCFNYSVKYKMYDLKDADGNPLMIPMSPDDHFADLKRVISACAGKAKRITVVMPMLYEGRQHKRSARESLDCALALQELENMGVSNIITFDAHDPRVQNSIRIGFESVSPTYQMIKAIAKSLNNDIKFNPQNTMMISPDEGGMGRCVYYSQVLGVELGMFYKRRDYTTVVDGRNPIISHEFLGDNVEGKDVIVVDDMISSGDSIIDVCRQLKNLKAKRIFVFSSFGLFTSGLERFDKAYAEGLFNRIFTTNLIYQTPELLSKEWYYSVDLSKYVALIIDTLNHDRSVSPFLNPIQKINDYIEKYNLK